MERFAGRRILVSGASSGIGKACAIRLAAEGADLILVGRNKDALKSVVCDREPVICTCDLTSHEAIQSLVSELKSVVGSVHGCVLAAANHALRPLAMETIAGLTSMWTLNVQSCLWLIGTAIKSRLLERNGSIVLFSSAAIHGGGSGIVSYAASKGAIEAATRSLANELAGQKIRVNAVAPGVVRTPMSERYLSKLSADQLARIESRHLLGFGESDDVAGVVSFLLSEDARWITGSVLPVDGGYCAT